LAAAPLTLTVESELIYDALDTLARIHAALARRHGDKFRALERDIERLADERLTLRDPHPLGDGWFIFEPPAQFTSMIDRANALGVI
jgi:hypothetical protein